MQQLKPKYMLPVEVEEVEGTLNDKEHRSSYKQVGSNTLACHLQSLPAEQVPQRMHSSLAEKASLEPGQQCASV
jgi:hypothetical protein